ncbi:hypothetical protein H2199_004334 [Coniosporium tulheliwenetii]|uniref:Uncharacterized protein n=1 Tax=Coniosporium tulheliwenetii TaxID=3383036 RepID=A0ACC2Z6L7_9PEZI|nr:hypothetical protein H2199_004334 [Cladosporium sp. JES 115]
MSFTWDDDAQEKFLAAVILVCVTELSAEQAQIIAALICPESLPFDPFRLYPEVVQHRLAASRQVAGIMFTAALASMSEDATSPPAKPAAASKRKAEDSLAADDDAEEEGEEATTSAKRSRKEPESAEGAVDKASASKRSGEMAMNSEDLGSEDMSVSSGDEPS